MAVTNRTGREGAIHFWGSSFACDPQGRMLAELSVDAHDVLVVDCELSRIESQRRGWPYLRDRRIDAYGELLGRYRR